MDKETAASLIALRYEVTQKEAAHFAELHEKIYKKYCDTETFSAFLVTVGILLNDIYYKEVINR